MFELLFSNVFSIFYVYSYKQKIEKLMLSGRNDTVIFMLSKNAVSAIYLHVNFLVNPLL